MPPSLYSDMVDWKVHTYASLSSTQDYVRELAEEGLPEGTLVQALTQENGHGRYGRDWVSPMGNLYMSFLLRPLCGAQEAGQISFVSALALSAAMDECLAPGCDKRLKWPNDILLDGRKVAGILLESDLRGDGVDSLVVGLGVNILSAPEGAAALGALCQDGVRLAVHPFRDAVLAQFSQFYQLWQREGFAPVRAAWLAQAHGLGEIVNVRLAGEEFSGIFDGLDEQGALLVRDDAGGVRSVSAGDVFFNEGGDDASGH